jgi:hypothetical protein
MATQAPAQQPHLKVEAVGIIDGTAGVTELNDINGMRYYQVTLPDAGGILKFGKALRVTFCSHVDKTTPVNVTYTLTTNRYRLYHNSGLVWDNQSLGAYNEPGNSSKPDMVAYNTGGTRVSLNGTQTIGTTVANASSFLILDHEVGLGTPSRPYFSGPMGESYRFENDVFGTVTYLGNTSDFAVPVEQTRVDIRLYPNNYRLQVSENLANWFDATHPSNMYVPYPAKIGSINGQDIVGFTEEDVRFIIALYPQDKPHPNLAGNAQRFYRFTDDGNVNTLMVAPAAAKKAVVAQPNATAEIPGDGIDNDDDGATDQADPDCVP